MRYSRRLNSMSPLIVFSLIQCNERLSIRESLKMAAALLSEGQTNTRTHAILKPGC